MARRQLCDAISRSGSVMETWASFSASAKVVGDTSGPASGADANVGGAPGVLGDGAACPDGDGASRVVPRQPAAAAIAPSGAVIRNFRRVFIGILAVASGAESGQDTAG